MERELIYVIEDDEGVQELYEGAFEESYDARIFGDGASFFAAFAREKPALVVVDIMLPDMDGYAIVSKIRETDERVPVIVVSARSDEMSFVKGLNKGADDYMTKPFSVLELLARVRAALRRARLYVARHGDFTVDAGNYKVFYKGADLGLTLKEYRLLRLLVSRAGTAVSREELFREGWGEDFMGETRALDMHIADIRAKLEGAGGKGVVETVRGVGYRID